MGLLRRDWLNKCSSALSNLSGLSSRDGYNEDKTNEMRDGPRCNEMGPDVCQMRFASVRLNSRKSEFGMTKNF